MTTCLILFFLFFNSPDNKSYFDLPRENIIYCQIFETINNFEDFTSEKIICFKETFQQIFYKFFYLLKGEVKVFQPP